MAAPLKADVGLPKENYKMELSKEEALNAYAKMLNTLDVTHIEGLLADDFSYESQMVMDALDSKERFLDYIKPKLQTISQSKATVFAEIGAVNAYGENQPCVILAQGKKTNLVGLVLAKVDSGKLTRLDLCIVPSPQTATRTGEYPI